MAQRNHAVAPVAERPRPQEPAAIRLLGSGGAADATVRDCYKDTVPTVGGRVVVDLSDHDLTSGNDTRNRLFWALTGIPDGTELIVRVGRTLPPIDCFPEVNTVPRIHVLVEGPDAETVRAAVNQFRTALTLWVQRTGAYRAERQEREAREAANHAWLAQRRAVTG